MLYRKYWLQRGVLAGAFAVLACLGPVGPASAQTEGADVNAVDPAATAALNAMGSYLRGLKAFQVQAKVSSEVVLEDGLKVEHRSQINLLARLPDRLWAESVGDIRNRAYFYDGREFTYWAPRYAYYATVPAPPTIGKLADELQERFGVEVPLVDLFRWGAPDVKPDPFTVARDLGPSTVDGVTCSQYAFRQDGLDWQIWIQRGDYPLPRRLVLTTTDDEARPQYAATYTWNLAPSYNESSFKFVPPRHALKIAMRDVSVEAGK